MKNRIEENGIAYKLVGDYYIPVLELPDEERSVGKYGRMHREYLKEYNPMIFNDLVLTGRLWTYLGVLWSSVFVTLVAKKDLGSYALTRAS